jgi:hypothetical protein
VVPEVLLHPSAADPAASIRPPWNHFSTVLYCGIWPGQQI